MIQVFTLYYTFYPKPSTQSVFAVSDNKVILCMGGTDTRDIDERRRNLVIEKIHQSALAIAKKRKVTLSEFEIVNQDPPALSDESITKATELACQELNLTHKKMISRAYHDSLFMAR